MKSIPLYHLELVRDYSIPFQTVTKIEQCAEILHELLDRSPVEQLIVMHLDPALNLVGVEKVGLGSITGVSVTMADIFRGAITASAFGVVLGHNHPGDDPTPSHADWDLTDKAMRAGGYLGIEVMDHVIVTPTGKHISMKSESIKLENKVVNKVLDVIAALPPEHQKQMEDRLLKYGINPDSFQRNPTKDIPIDAPKGTSLVDMMKYRLDKLNNSKKSSN